MKKTTAVIVSVLFLFALTLLSFADEEKKVVTGEEEKAEPAAPAEKPRVRQVTGEVKAVDTEAMTFTVTKVVRGKTKRTVVTVNDGAEIMMGKERKALADVKVGNKVTITYIEVGGKNVAKSVVILSQQPPEERPPEAPKGT